MRRILVIIFIGIFSIIFTSCSLFITNIIEEVVDNIVEVPFLNDEYSPTSNSKYFPIIFCDKEEYQYTVNSDWGCLFIIGEHEEYIPIYNSMSNINKIGWCFDEKTENNEYPIKDYIVIIREKDKNIVGCVIIELIKNYYIFNSYFSEIVYSVSYPKVDGKYQYVTKKYIDEKLNKIKNESEDPYSNMTIEEYDREIIGLTQSYYNSSLEEYGNIIDCIGSYSDECSVYCDWGELYAFEGNEVFPVYENMQKITGIGWKPYKNIDSKEYPEMVYIVYIPKEEGNIVGCVIIELTKDYYNNYLYYIEQVYSAVYPMIYPKYQPVTENFIRKKVEEYKKNTYFEVLDNTDIIEEKITDMLSVDDVYDLSTHRGYLPIYLKNEKREYQFTAFSENDSIYTVKEIYHGENQIIPIEENMLFFSNIRWDITMGNDEKYPDSDYVVVIKQNKGLIIACTIIEITKDKNAYFSYNIDIVYSVSYPKIDGKYQNVTREYIDNKLKEIKNVQ